MSNLTACVFRPWNTCAASLLRQRRQAMPPSSKPLTAKVCHLAILFLGVNRGRTHGEVDCRWKGLGPTSFFRAKRNPEAKA
jgi:hypothetical protein